MTTPKNYVMAKRLNALPNLANSVNLAATGDCRSGYRRTSVAQAPHRVADGGARLCHLRVMAHGDLFLPRVAVVGPDRDRRLAHRLAIEPSARDHTRPSDPQPRCQRGDRLLAAVAVAPLPDLPLDPPRPPSRRQFDRSAR